LLSTYLCVGDVSDKANGDPGRSFRLIEARGPEWSIPENIGRRCAAVSGPAAGRDTAGDGFKRPIFLTDKTQSGAGHLLLGRPTH